ncbi:MAG: ATP-binding protein [Methanophagales archaeon]|nr:ATP-binding protein [Methanophagales archaeon]
MKQIAIISGKGGTGKTTIAAAFAALASNKIIADCDVDAPNLYLVLNPAIKAKKEFKGSQTAVIDEDKCTECGLCEDTCRFDAIHDYEINPILCEGCGVCGISCPEEAIRLEEGVSGYTFISDTKYGPLSHARLHTAEEASGKLVTVVRDSSIELARGSQNNLILIDGPPGIGCPVIASLSGVDIALIVTEPSQSGLHDLKRILGVVEHFSVKPLVCINKYDINEEVTGEIEALCKKKGIELVGKIRYDESITKAMVEGVPVVEFETERKSKAAEEIKGMWNRVKQILQPS